MDFVSSPQLKGEWGEGGGEREGDNNTCYYYQNLLEGHKFNACTIPVVIGQFARQGYNFLFKL